MKRDEYNDPMARALVKAFKDAIDPIIARVTKGWGVHHLELRREHNSIDDPFEQQLEIRIIIKPNKRLIEGP
jgi:hypothetical protein